MSGIAMNDKLTAAEAVEAIRKRLAKHDERGKYTVADFVNGVRCVLECVSPQAEPTQESVERAKHLANIYTQAAKSAENAGMESYYDRDGEGWLAVADAALERK